jgi:maltose O-acetyltransferase
MNMYLLRSITDLPQKLRDIILFYGIVRAQQNIRLKWLVKNGLKLGTNCYIAPTAFIDEEFPWLISIGDESTLTFNSMILSHDASTKRHLGYSKIGTVTIGKRCYVGAGTIILPNVHIGNNVIIGSGSVVTRDIPDDSVAAGNPAKVINTLQDFLDRHSANLLKYPTYKEEGWTLKHRITQECRRKMLSSIEDKIGYIG